MARTKLFNEDEVLDKAVCLFWNKGYNGTSMQDLVDSLGISRSSLYDTYTDKHTLYLKALERYQEAGNARIKNIAEMPIPAKDRIRELLQLFTADLLNQQRGCFLVNAELEVAPHDATVNDMVCKNNQLMEESFSQIITQGQQNGEISTNQDATALTRFLINTTKGMRVSAGSIKDPEYFRGIMETALSVLG